MCMCQSALNTVCANTNTEDTGAVHTPWASTEHCFYIQIKSAVSSQMLVKNLTWQSDVWHSLTTYF